VENGRITGFDPGWSGFALYEVLVDSDHRVSGGLWVFLVQLEKLLKAFRYLAMLDFRSFKGGCTMKLATTTAIRLPEIGR
jgi:hypothetical protein